ncbi:MAG: phosphatidate cytidylyltransferase [Chloroflexota bacterium]
MLHNNLVQRILSAAVILLVAIPVTVYGGPAFSLFVLVVAAAGWWECVTMGRAGGFRPFLLVGGVATLGVCVLAAAPAVWRDLALLAAFGGVVLAALRRRDYTAVLNDMAITLFGVVWIGWLAGYAIYLRGIAGGVNGLAWLLTAIAVTIAADSGAYFTGRALGRHLLSPRVSPKKTVEGLFGGLVAAAAVGAAAALLALGRPWWQGVLIGVAGGLAAVLGDLLESLVKRQLNVKDSSRLIPGHGGVLDRIDSLLFVIPVMAACVILIQSG